MKLLKSAAVNIRSFKDYRSYNVSLQFYFILKNARNSVNMPNVCVREKQLFAPGTGVFFNETSEQNLSRYLYLYQDFLTLPNVYVQNAENVQILHRYHRITSILCVQVAGLILNMS